MTVKLWSQTDVASFMDVTASQVNYWRHNGMLPEPFATARGTPYWHPDTIRLWAVTDAPSWHRRKVARA